MVSTGKNVRMIAFFVAGAMIMLFSGNAKAQKVAIVDGNKVLTELPAAIEADKKLRAMGQMWIDSVQLMTNQLMEKAESYRKIFETATEEKKKELQAEVTKRENEIAQYRLSKLDQAEGQLAKERAAMLQPILDKIKSTISTVAKKKKVDIVIDKATTLFAAEGVVDITSDVQSALK